MKIIQAVGWYFPDSLGGTEIYVAALSRRFVTAGHDVAIAAPDPASDVARTYEHEGVRVYRYPIPSSPTRAECQGDPVRGADLFHRWLEAERPDVVHVHTFVTGLGLHEVRAAKAAGARVIVTTHSSSLGYLCQRGTLMRWGEQVCDGVCEVEKCAACALHARGLSKAAAEAVASMPVEVSRALARVPGRLGTALGMPALIARNQAMQQEMLRATDRFVLLTEWARRIVGANGAAGGTLAINRLGADFNGVGRKPGPLLRPTRRPIRIGYVGRFEAVKGVHDLARAVASLPADVPLGVEFRGPINTPADRAALVDLTSTLGRDPRVTFAAAVPHHEIPAVLATYDLLCCPGRCLEGGPTVAIEAMGVGTPVLGTRIGGLAELIDEGVTGRLVEPADWVGLAAALREAADDPRGTIDRWRAALPPARSMDEVAAEYLRVYAA